MPDEAMALVSSGYSELNEYLERRHRWCERRLEEIDSGSAPTPFIFDAAADIAAALPSVPSANGSEDSDDGDHSEFVYDGPIDRLSFVQEIAALDKLIAAMDDYKRTFGDLDSVIRSTELMAESPDYRPECQKYILKQDVTFINVRINNEQMVVCKTIADEMVNTFIGLPEGEITTENLTTWYTRTGRFNISAELKLKVMGATIYYAERRIRSFRHELGLSYNSNLNKVREAVDCGRGVWSTIVNAWDSTPSLPLLPKLLTTAVSIAGMPYGVFGVRKMRPIKQDF